MITTNLRCANGCHGQMGLMLFRLFQFELGWDLSKLKFGVKGELDRDHWLLSVLVYFGPFQFAAGLRLRPFRPTVQS